MPQDANDQPVDPEKNKELPPAIEEAAATDDKLPKPPERGTSGLEGVKIEAVPGVPLGAEVGHNNEKWKAVGGHDGKAMLFQKGRGETFAGEFKFIDGKPDPQKYTELPKFEGQEKGSTYYADKSGRVVKVQDAGNGKSLMVTAHDLKLAEPAQLYGFEASPAAEKKGSEIKLSSEPTAAAEPKIGDKVEFNGEKLKVGAVVDGNALLYEVGRNSDYAISPIPVTDQQLKSDYKEVKVNIDGKTESRYMSKDGKGPVLQLMEFAGKKSLYTDHSFETAKLSELGPEGKKAATARVESKPEVKKEAPPKVESKPEPKAEVVETKAASTDLKGLPEIGKEVRFGKEKLSVAAYEGNHVLLQKPGRNLDYAVISEPVSDKELKNNFQEIKVNIDGKEEIRYIEKGHPERGVYGLTEFGGQKALTADHSFEVVSKDSLRPKESSPKPKVTDKPTVPDLVAEKPAEKAPEIKGELPPPAELREGKMTDGTKATERVSKVDGKEVKVRTPQAGDKGENRFKAAFNRELEIDGKKFELTRGGMQQWFYSRESPALGELDKSKEQVKLHVTGVDAKDLARLQAGLTPELEKMLDKGEIKQYKTFDPNFSDGKWATHPDKYGNNPGPDGQSSKAFTIYLPPDKAAEVAAKVDKILKEKGLTLDSYKGDNVGELSRKQSESQRVSLERDMWKLTYDASNSPGALLDEKLSQKLHEQHKDKLDSKGMLSEEALRAIEKEAGIEKGQLTYDKNGRLMFLDGNGGSSKQSGDRFYADESKSNKTEGRKTGRPAIYALYEKAGLDPARVFVDEMRIQQEALAKSEAPQRQLPKAEALQNTDTRPQNDGTLTRNEVKPGEVLAREQLEKRERVDAKEIESMKRYAEELERKGEKEKASAIKRTVDALEGKMGREAQIAAHKEVLSESRKALERGEGGGYGKAVVGGLVAVGILAAAALAFYRSQLKAAEEEALERVQKTTSTNK